MIVLKQNLIQIKSVWYWICGKIVNFGHLLNFKILCPLSQYYKNHHILSRVYASKDSLSNLYYRTASSPCGNVCFSLNTSNFYYHRATLLCGNFTFNKFTHHTHHTSHIAHHTSRTLWRQIIESNQIKINEWSNCSCCCCW